MECTSSTWPPRLMRQQILSARLNGGMWSSHHHLEEKHIQRLELRDSKSDLLGYNASVCYLLFQCLHRFLLEERCFWFHIWVCFNYCITNSNEKSHSQMNILKILKYITFSHSPSLNLQPNIYSHKLWLKCVLKFTLGLHSRAHTLADHCVLPHHVLPLVGGLHSWSGCKEWGQSKADPAESSREDLDNGGWRRGFSSLQVGRF